MSMGEGLTVLRVGNAGDASGADIIDVNDVATALTTLEERSVDGVFLPADRATPDVGILREHHPTIPIVVVGRAQGTAVERKEQAVRTATEDEAVTSLEAMRAERDAESALREHRGLQRAVGRIAADTAASHDPTTVAETALDHLLSTERFRFGFDAERRDEGSVIGLPGTDAPEFQVTETETRFDAALEGAETTVLEDSDPPAVVVPTGADHGLVLFTADGSTPDPGERSVLDDLATLLRERRAEAGRESPEAASDPAEASGGAEVTDAEKAAGGTADPESAAVSANAPDGSEESAAGESDVLVEMLAHELRSPLDLGRGRLEMAVEDGEEEDIERAIETFDRIEDVVSAGVALARLETDEEEPVDVAERARSVWEDTATAGAELEVDADGLGPIPADASLLDRLLSNLFRNAVEHGSSGSASVGDQADDGPTVRVGALDDGDGFFVSDDGEGIDPADRERILEPGVSLGDNGTGYGLAIVDRVARAHDWDVSVGESAAGGARFEIRTAE
jgi:anti-sigma regulatory factor (Ser/Thr protein kinase)